MNEGNKRVDSDNQHWIKFVLSSFNDASLDISIYENSNFDHMEILTLMMKIVTVII